MSEPKVSILVAKRDERIYLCLCLIIVNYCGASTCKGRCSFYVIVIVLSRFYDCENQRIGICKETDNLHYIFFENSKADSDAHDTLKIFRAVHMCTTNKLSWNLSFRKGKNYGLRVLRFRSHINKKDSCTFRILASCNPHDRLSMITNVLRLFR